jgi:hypothetical protein
MSTSEPALTPEQPQRLPAPPELHPPINHRRRRSRGLVALVFVLILMAGIVGTSTYNLYRGGKNSTQLTQQKAILDYLSGNKVSQASAEGNLYLIAQLQQICIALSKRPQTLGVALPSCKVIPVPPLIQQALNAAIQASTPTTTTTVPSNRRVPTPP